MQIQNDVKNTQQYQFKKNEVNNSSLEKSIKMLADEHGFDYKSLLEALTTSKESDNKEIVEMKKSMLKSLIDRIRIMRADRYTAKSWGKLLDALKKSLPISNDSSPSEISVTKAINNVLAGMTGLVDAEIEESKGSENDKKNVFINEAARQAAKAQAELKMQGFQSSASTGTETVSEAGFADGAGSVIEISL